MPGFGRALEMNMARKKLDGDDMPEANPLSVTVSSYYGFYAEDGTARFWSQGQVVTDADDIKLLLERDAPLEPYVIPVAPVAPVTE
jgi:hypothetical protein